MTCKNCGCDIPKNQNICPNCGCDCNEANATYSVQINKTFSNLLEENVQDNDLYIQSATDNDDEYIKTTEPKHIYPTMCQRGTDEGIPDMDLGRSTRYINRRRKTPAKKTLIEKIVLQFRPSKDASLDEYIKAAEKKQSSFDNSQYSGVYRINLRNSMVYLCRFTLRNSRTVVPVRHISCFSFHRLRRHCQNIFSSQLFLFKERVQNTYFYTTSIIYR